VNRFRFVGNPHISGCPFFFGFLVVASFMGVSLSEDHDPKKAFTNAVRQIGGLVEKDELGWNQAEAALKRGYQDPATKESAIVAVAWLHIRRGNSVAISKLIERLPTLFPDPSLDFKSQLQRVQLRHFLASDAPEISDRFDGLVETLLDPKLSQPNQLACAAMLGTTIGILTPECASSPIDTNRLESARSSILKMENIKVAMAFDGSYRRARARAESMSNWLDEHRSKLGVSDEKLVEEGLRNLESNADVQAKAIESANQETRSCRKQIYDLKQQIGRITKEIDVLEKDWKRRPEIHNPVEPNRAQIALRVPTTHRVKVGTKEKRVKKTRIRNGKEETYYDTELEDDYEWRQRPRSAIEQDINQIYVPLLQIYTTLKSQKDTMLAARAKKDIEKADAQKTINALHQRLEEIEDEKKDLVDDNRDYKSEQKLLADIAMALKAEDPKMAFRPPLLEIVDYSAEIQAVLRRLSAHEQK
jgi:hypothetical protein